MIQDLNLYIEQDANMVAGLASQDRPACDGIIMKLGEPREVLAVTLRSNPLAEGWLLDADFPSDRVVTWSGTLGDDLFEPHPMTWMKAGHEALALFCDEISPQLQRHGRTLCFQPHARHVLSDAQSCVRFARERSEQPFEIAFSPASILEESMFDRLDDHLVRAFEAVESMADANAMLMLHDVAPPDMRPAPLGDGSLPRELVRRLIERYVDHRMPIVLMPQRLDQQLQWLGENS